MFISYRCNITLKRIKIIIIGIIAVFFVVKGFSWVLVSGSSREVTTEEDYYLDYPRKEDGRRYTYSGNHSRIKPDKVEIYVRGELIGGSVEFVFFNEDTGLEYQREIFSEIGSVDFRQTLKEKTQDVDVEIIFSDDAHFVGTVGTDMHAFGYKTWFRAY